MVDVAGDGGDDGGAFGVDHLLVGHVHLAPGAGFLQRGRGAGSVAHVGHRDLDGVLVHGHVEAEDFGANDGVLREVLRGAAADHEQARGAGLDFDLGQFHEILHGVDGHVLVGVLPLVLADAESRAAVGECRAENGHSALIAGLDEAVFLHGVALAEPFADFPDELAGRVGTRLQMVGDFVSGVVASLQFLLVDECVVDTVYVKFAQLHVGDVLAAFVVFETERFKQVHVDDGRSGGDHDVNHLVAHHVDIHLHAAGGAGASGDGEDVRAFLFRHHLHEDVGCPGGVAGSE